MNKNNSSQALAQMDQSQLNELNDLRK
jgi:hypothetical protein